MTQRGNSYSLSCDLVTLLYVLFDFTSRAAD